MDNVAIDMMMDFLGKHCPIAKVKVKENSNKFSRTLIINGAFIRGADRSYPMAKKHEYVKSMMEDLQVTLKNVFGFPHMEIAVVVSRYLELD